MPFVRPTITTIKDRIEKGIEDRLFGSVALLRNAILRILARVFAGAIHGNYGYIEYLSRQLFVTTAETEYLNRHGRMWGIERKAGSFAISSAYFYGTNGTVIPLDTRIQSDGGIEYGTTAAGVIASGFALIPIQAVEVGTEANYTAANPLDPYNLQMVTPLSGINDIAEVFGNISGGDDVESDEEYRARILQRIQTIPTGGSAADYVRWATEYPGVEKAWCYPLADGAGTVSVAFIASGSDPVPSAALIASVNTYIQEKRPVTADVTIQSITDYSGSAGKTLINIWVSLPLAQNTTDYQETIEANLTALLFPHKPGTNVLISQIRSAISNSGVSDYEITQIDLDGNIQSIDDLVLSGYMYPYLGAVTYGVL